MSEEAICELVVLAGEQSILYGCKSLGYTRKYKTDLVWGKHRESMTFIIKYTTAYILA